MTTTAPMKFALITAVVIGCGGDKTPANPMQQGSPPMQQGAPAGSGGLPGNGDCSAQCCFTPKPAEGAPCVASAEGQSCPDVLWCASGLILENRVLTCEHGTWVAKIESCPAPNTVNERGCPAGQPNDQSACSAAEGTVCRYYRDCVTGTCADGGIDSSDGGVSTGCVPAHQVYSEPAVCMNGKWSTTMLKACN